MIFSRFLLCCALLVSMTGFAQELSFPSPLSPRTASYDIDLVLDTKKHQVHAQQKLTFTNPSADTIWTMPFHMYYNAFKNNRTSFMTEASSIPRDKSAEDIENGVWSWIEVLEVKDAAGNDLTANMAYIQPDNDLVHDHTVLEIRLQEPVLPYATYELDMKWQSQIPKLMIRTGYSRNFYFMVQWYPKLGVYESAGTRFAQEGQWNCHQYHASTEYYGEFGRYEVTMTVPQEYQLGASGFLAQKENKDTLTAYTYIAEDVIDFAWTVHPDFVAITDRWQDTEIKLLALPEHLCKQDRFLATAKNTLDFFADYLEPYPYPTLTIVSPPYYGMMAGAMEYPTLFTAPTMCGLPAGLRMTETLTIHELTHQYFMQMLATNEQEEPWMDEGFTSFFEAKILDKYYPSGTISWNYMGIHIGSAELRRGRFLNADNIKVNPISDFGWHFKHGSYSEIVYGKTAVWLRTLEGLVGEDVMQDIIRTYFQRWKFKHPGRQDFIDVVNEVVPKHHGDKFGPDMNWFLDQAIYGTDACDYAVHSISNEVVPPAAGYLDKTSSYVGVRGEERGESNAVLRTSSNTNDLAQTGPFRADSSEQGESEILSKVVLFRLEGFVVPQEVLITFDNGHTQLEYWDGKARSHEFSYRGPHRIISAQIDPAGKIPLDKNLINNSYTLQQEQPGILRYVTSFLTWVEGAMVSMGMFI